MFYSKLVNKVLKFAYNVHDGSVDKNGMPYILHPLAVAEQMDDENSTLLALLHDVVEDTSYTFDDIKALGVPEQVISALKLLTHNDNDSYFDYVKKIKQNALATKVKLADLRHNSNLARLDSVSSKDLERVEKYAKAIEILLN